MAPLLLAAPAAGGTVGLFGAGGAFSLSATAATIGAGAVVAGGIQQAQAARAEAEGAQNIANFNAAVQEREAKAEKIRAGFASKRQAKRAAEIKSALTAKIAAAGGLGSPVAADLAAAQAEELDLENLLIGFEGEVRAQRALSQADLDRLSGRIAKQRGRRESQAAIIRTGTTLLTGFN